MTSVYGPGLQSHIGLGRILPDLRYPLQELSWRTLLPRRRESAVDPPTHIRESRPWQMNLPTGTRDSITVAVRERLARFRQSEARSLLLDEDVWRDPSCGSDGTV